MSDERALALEAAARRYGEELVRVREPVPRARALAAWAAAALASGSAPVAVDLLERALAELGETLPRHFLGFHLLGGHGLPAPAAAPPPGDEGARLEAACDAFAGLAAACDALGDGRRASLGRTRRVELAARLGPGPRLAQALGERAVAAIEAGEGERTAEALQAIDRLQAALPPDARPALVAVARRCRALAALEGGRASEARAAAAEARRFAGALGDPGEVLASALVLARAEGLFGAPAAALAAAEDARRLAREAGDDRAGAEADAIEGLARVLGGDVSRGNRQIDRAGARAGASAPATAHEARLRAVADLSTLALGRPDALAALAGREGTVPGPTVTLCLPALAEAEAALDLLDAGGRRRPSLRQAALLGERAASRLEGSLAAARRLPALAARRERLAAVLAAERGDPGAIEALARAVDACRARAGPVDSALALVALGACGARLEGRDAGPACREAEVIARDCGARLVEARARALADASGREPQAAGEPAAAAGGEGGDGRREVAALVQVGRALSSILELDPLLERIMDEVVTLLGADRGFVMLYDRPGGELRVRVARNLDRERLPPDELLVSRTAVAEVERTREPLIVVDAARDARFQTRFSVMNLGLRSILCAPLKTSRSLVGILYADSRSVRHSFRARDGDVVLPFVAQAAVAIENASAFERIRALYEETLSVAKAREKILHHLSHELRTPIGLIRSTLHLLARRAASGEGSKGPPPAEIVDIADRQLKRLVDLQLAIADIYGSAREAERRVSLATLLERAVAAARAAAPSRHVEVAVEADPSIEVLAPDRPLEIALSSLLKNAIENTPDEGRIVLSATAAADGRVQVAVRDHGVGIPAESRAHIFEGFYHTQDTERYSSRRPYDFDAGGKGLDLLRVRAFSERFGWRVSFESERCRFIPAASDLCPGKISGCPHVKTREDCLGSGGATFKLDLPATPPEPAPAPTSPA